MKDELIELSKEKGFLSRDKLVSVYNSYYYLWMCELQQWLREVHNIQVYVYSTTLYMNNQYKDYVYNIDGNNLDTRKGFDKYEEALEEALKQSLQLIK